MINWCGATSCTFLSTLYDRVGQVSGTNNWVSRLARGQADRVLVNSGLELPSVDIGGPSHVLSSTTALLSRSMDGNHVPTWSNTKRDYLPVYRLLVNLDWL